MHFQSIYLPPYEFKSLKIKLYLIDFPKVATEQNYCKSKILSTTFYSFHYCNRFENMVWNWNSKLLFPKGPSKGTNSFWKVYIAENVPWFITLKYTYQIHITNMKPWFQTSWRGNWERNLVDMHRNWKSKRMWKHFGFYDSEAENVAKYQR